MKNYHTELYPELASLIQATPAGMAHWAGTGPAGKVCRDCAAWVLIENKRLCEKYKRMMGKDEWDMKKVIPGDTAACRHFEQKPIPPSPRRGEIGISHQAREKSDT
jgi:hypothetical protein